MGINSIQPSNSLNLDKVFQTMAQPLDNKEQDLDNYMNNLKPDQTSQDQNQDAQTPLNEWTVTTALATNTLKTLSDGIKATINNTRA